MKKNTTLILLLLVVGAGLMGFVSHEANEKYDYLTINQNTNYPGLLKISSTAADYEEIRTGIKVKDAHDFTPALTKVSEYETLGWEYVESTTYIGPPGISIVMRKKK